MKIYFFKIWKLQTFDERVKEGIKNTEKHVLINYLMSLFPLANVIISYLSIVLILEFPKREKKGWLLSNEHNKNSIIKVFLAVNVTATMWKTWIDIKELFICVGKFAISMFQAIFVYWNRIWIILCVCVFFLYLIYYVFCMYKKKTNYSLFVQFHRLPLKTKYLLSCMFYLNHFFVYLYSSVNLIYIITNI